jgi:hypothetical protein
MAQDAREECMHSRLRIKTAHSVISVDNYKLHLIADEDVRDEGYDISWLRNSTFIISREACVAGEHP